MNRSSKGSYISAIGIILFLVIFSLLFPGLPMSLTREPIDYINSNWQAHWIENNIEKAQHQLTLPADLDVPANTSLVIEHLIDGDIYKIDDNPAIGIRSSLQHIELAMDGIAFYERNFDSNSTIVMPIASAWHVVQIPENSQGKVLSIRLQSPYKEMSGTINPVMIGTPDQIQNEIRSQYGFRFYFSLLIFLIGLFIIAFDLIIRSSTFNGFVNLGFFAVFLSFWILAESRMLQFFTGNQWLIGSLAYLALAVFPMPLLYYIRNHIVERIITKKIYTLFVFLFAMNALFVIILQITGVRGFFDTLIFTHILIGLGILLIISTLLIETIKQNNMRARRFLLHISILIIFGLIEQVNFIQEGFEITSIFVLIGISLFLLMQSVYMGRQMTTILKKSYQAEAFEMLAFVDPLTKGKNRMAFERDLDQYFHQAQENAFELKKTRKHSIDQINQISMSEHKEKQLYLIFFDFDGLKAINDTMGHHHGDEAIQNGYNLINQTFSEIGKCYRIGGDEFACIVPSSDFHTLHCMLESFELAVNNYSKKLPYHLSISVGFTAYNDQNDSKPGDIMRRADQVMYQQKQQRKKRKQILV